MDPGSEPGVTKTKEKKPLPPGRVCHEIMLDIKHGLVYPPAVIAAGLMVFRPRRKGRFFLRKRKTPGMSLLRIAAEARLRKGSPWLMFLRLGAG